MAKKLKLKDLNPPYPVCENISSFRPHKTDGREISKVIVLNVANWLKEINEKYNLGLEIRFNSEFEVVALKGEEEVAKFYYFEGSKRVCRKQNFEKLLKLIESV